MKFRQYSLGCQQCDNVVKVTWLGSTAKKYGC